MKNKRQISKETTRKLILEKTRELIVKNGILNTSTKSISDYCMVAHGTIFSHFENREKLISTVVKIELTEIAKKLYTIEEPSTTIDGLISEYLKLVEDDEDFLVVINKEFAFLDHNLQREIITTESIVKNLFYNKLSKSIADKNIKSINIHVAISALFGTISHYLIRKEYFVVSGSVMKEKKEEILNTFIELLIK